MDAPAPKTRHPIHTFDIDNYINPYVPRPPFSYLPAPISFWFGYRPPKEPSKPAPHPTSHPLVWLFSFLGAFIGIAIIENVFMALPPLDGHKVPIVVASFGAAAILEYNAIESPLSQPRNLIVGHSLSAVIGVTITKLFHLLPEARFQQLRWLAGALAVGSASTIMGITKTVHPPAGATALLAATTDEFVEIGWWLVILVMLGGGLMLTSAMLVNNLYKRFPLYWWTPIDLKKLRESRKAAREAKDLERAQHAHKSDASLNSDSDTGRKDHADSLATTRKASDLPETEHKEEASVKEGQGRIMYDDEATTMKIDKDSIVVPGFMQLSDFETQMLEMFQQRMTEED